MALLPLWHCDAFPVRSTSGVSYPWQVQPFTTTGAPPPFPGTCPSLSLAAYSFSTRMAVVQFTEPLATVMTTGTPAAVRALPHLAPAVAGPDEHPVKKQVPRPHSVTNTHAVLPARTVSP
jgi:hypothetical protein